MISSQEIRESFLNFFKKRGHVVVPSSSLIPTDPSVLLTTAGVQQFKPYYTGQLDPMKDFGAKRVVSIQKCFRTTDIDDVGDGTHLTFFEMLGNFCFGDYWKKEAIQFGYDFIVKELGVASERVSVTVFTGNDSVSRDEESFKIWCEDVGIPEAKISFALWDNFWGPTGNGGPCGPTTEIYIDGIEVWNIVFNEYFCHGSREELLAGKARLEKLEKNGVDTGMGLERLVAVINGVKDVYEIDLLNPLLEKVRSFIPELEEKKKRIITDHLRSSIFLISDGVRPMNKESGYVLRRLLRRIMAYKSDFKNLSRMAVEWVKEKYGDSYEGVADYKILEVIELELDKFGRAVTVGVSVVNKIIWDTPEELGKKLFNVYQELGINFELSIEILRDKGIKIDYEAEARKTFDQRFSEHKKTSQIGVEKKFGGHGLLLDTGELKAGNEEELKKVTRLHTATHLLQQALRDVLGAEVQQCGSDITVERTRFDFSFSRKLSPEEIKKVEEIVNQKIKEDLPVNFVEMSKDEAMKTGALFFFKEKYPEKVKVYFIGGSPSTSSGRAAAYSAEFCGGPHVKHTSEVGPFKILKEEAIGAGMRRIRAGVT